MIEVKTYNHKWAASQPKERIIFGTIKAKKSLEHIPHLTSRKQSREWLPEHLNDHFEIAQVLFFHEYKILHDVLVALIL